MHNAFDAALEQLRGNLGKSYGLIINGEERPGAGAFEVRSPSDNQVLIGQFAIGTELDVHDAVAAARAAFPAWSQLPWQERVSIMRRAAALIREQKFRLAALLILEAGKNRIEANDGFARQLDSLDPAERNRSVLRPFGVWAVLAPFNFPHALSVGMSSGALLAGNTVVYKPASATPLSGYELARIYADAGVPAGVFNYVSGSGEAVGDPLTRHPDVDGVVFTGSREVGWELYKEFSTDFPKPCITELGGKNPTIVTRNADLDKAVEGVARSAFGYSGQKCSACSRVYVEEPVYDEFMERLTQRTKELVVGDPTDRETYVGPVIDQRAVRRYEDALASAQGGQVRTGVQRLRGGIFDRGTYVAPTVVDGLPLDHALFKKEIFLPFIVVAPVKGLDQAIEEANDTDYGLTAGIFSEDREEIDTFFDRIEAGVVYANRKGGATTGAWPGCQSFAGWKASGSTGKGGLGPYYVQQFMREQSQTVVVGDDEPDDEAGE